jgi:hypothetical protein
MKTNITLGTLLTFYALSVSTAKAQVPDTMRYQSPAIQQNSTSIQQNSTTINQTTVSTPPPAPVAAPPAPAPAPEAVATEEHHDAPLRRGEFGVRYMPTFSALRVRTENDEVVKGTLSMSHGWGAFIGFNFTRHVGIVGEVNYIQINQKYKDRSLDRQINVSYLNLPVMLSLNTNKEAPVNLNFVVGPQFGLNLGAKATGNASGNTSSATVSVGAKKGDVGAAYGAGLEFALNPAHTVRLDVGFRGYYGFLDMDSNVRGNTATVSLTAARQTYAGYIGLAFLFYINSILKRPVHFGTGRFTFLFYVTLSDV